MKGGEISPFLFLSENSEQADAQIQSFAYKLLAEAGIPSSYLFSIKDTWESIKIKDMKLFLEKSHRKASFDFQIFFIENISRMTIKAANAALKFLEEPGEWNIVFLTNASEAWVLDTILSRVQSITISAVPKNTFRQDYYDMLDTCMRRNDTKLISYFFSEKLDKSDYVDFLKTLVYYAGKNPGVLSIDTLTELEEDINLVQKNNLLPKYVADKYILGL